MAKNITTTYDVGDKVWWQTRGKVYCGRITSIQIVIDKFGTRLDYIVLVYDKFVGYEFYELLAKKKHIKQNHKQSRHKKKNKNNSRLAVIFLLVFALLSS